MCIKLRTNLKIYPPLEIYFEKVLVALSDELSKSSTPSDQPDCLHRHGKVYQVIDYYKRINILILSPL